MKKCSACTQRSWYKVSLASMKRFAEMQHCFLKHVTLRYQIQHSCWIQGRTKRCFFLSFMGIAFALWVSLNMSIWYIAVTFWCFSDYTVMIACLMFVTISPPSRCCIVICQTDNAVQLVFVHCATRVVFISGYRGNMFQEWFGCRHRWAVWQN